MNKITTFLKDLTLLKLFYLLLAGLSVSGLIAAPVALAIGLVFAFVFGNPFKRESQKISKFLLKWSIVGLGFGMNIYAVANASESGFVFAAITIIGTLLVGLVMGKLFKIELNTSILISSGTAICGGSAIAAVGPVINADQKSMSVALVTIFILNAIALFIFPVLGHLFELTEVQFGTWCAIAIHDTSSVVGASAKYGEEALKTAISIKLTRALWIIPLALGVVLLKKQKNKKIYIPWFILFFVLATVITTLVPQGAFIYGNIKEIAKHGLIVTLFLIGSSITKEDIKIVGFKPMLQGVLLWIIIAITSLMAIVKLI